ncbi:MAG: class I SAM-dependent methyltransferase [Actinomycetota bacterium]|nr:class I SAM-dependent methyltransferase [Actinomycetota bacterium]
MTRLLVEHSNSVGTGRLTSQRSVWERLAFYTHPGGVADWRIVLLHEAAEEAGLLDALPGAPAALADRLGLNAHAVRVVLEALAVWGVVEARPDGAFAPGPEFPNSDEAAVLRHHARSVRVWAGTGDRLRGSPVPVHDEPRRVKIMLDALVVNGRESAPGAVDGCLARVPDARRVLDLGGGHGEYGIEFARRGLQVVMQDRPEVVDYARRRQEVIEAGVELFAGDFFETLPAGPFDVVFCAGVVYTLAPERVVELFRRVRPLVAPGGRLAVHTFLRGSDEMAAIFAVQMLAVSGGDTHSEGDFRHWFERARYPSVEVVRLHRRPESMLFAERSPD